MDKTLLEKRKKILSHYIITKTEISPNDIEIDVFSDGKLGEIDYLYLDINYKTRQFISLGSASREIHFLKIVMERFLNNHIISNTLEFRVKQNANTTFVEKLFEINYDQDTERMTINCGYEIETKSFS